MFYTSFMCDKRYLQLISESVYKAACALSDFEINSF